MNNHAKNLFEKIQNQKVKVGIIGLGYVGLPLAISFAEKGFSVVGFDIDHDKVEKLQKGECYIKHLDGNRLPALVSQGKLQPTADFSRLKEPDCLLICVPTPLTKHKEPDLTFVVETAKAIKKTLRREQLIVLESTTYPGTTDGLLKEILEASGLIAGEDFFLAFSPEREDPGNPDYSTTNIPKVIGGVDKVSAELADLLYRQIVPQTILVSSARTAEATKLMENIFRAVNIALVNELKMIYDKMGIDVWEVLDAAETKPFGFMRFNPGPGWGGHCIPIDPFYLSWKAREYGITPKFIELAGEINIRMPEYVVEKLIEALNQRGKPLRGSRILLLGLAYKKDVEDPRESPAFEIMDLLLRWGAEVQYHDPYIPVAPKMRSWPDLPAMKSIPLTKENLQKQDAVIITTNHSSVDYSIIFEHSSLIVDTRGVYRKPHPKVVKA